jgi:hypothetical protein
MLCVYRMQADIDGLVHAQHRLWNVLSLARGRGAECAAFLGPSCSVEVVDVACMLTGVVPPAYCVV